MIVTYENKKTRHKENKKKKKQENTSIHEETEKAYLVSFASPPATAMDGEWIRPHPNADHKRQHQHHLQHHNYQQQKQQHYYQVLIVTKLLQEPTVVQYNEISRKSKLYAAAAQAELLAPLRMVITAVLKDRSASIY